jgi:hypothetical protein
MGGEVEGVIVDAGGLQNLLQIQDYRPTLPYYPFANQHVRLLLLL